MKINKININNLDQCISRLLDWFSTNGWSGWDPYDIKTSTIIGYFDAPPLTFHKKVGIRLYSHFIDCFPNLTRKVFSIKPTINAKGMGLLLGSYAKLYDISKEETYLIEAKKIAQWLSNNHSSPFSGMCWGYPFDWQSQIFIPKNTPSSVVTATVGDGFYQLYLVTKDQTYLDICHSVCEFFINDLNVSYCKGNSKCRSYTPIDTFQVHNANLFVAEYLARIGKLSNKDSYLEEASLLSNFALEEQTKEGYLPYWGLAQTDDYSGGKIRFDHYHCGFEIRSLYSLYKSLNTEKLKLSYQKYFSFYKTHLFKNDYIPLIRPNTLYPIDIHACAESILCRAALLPDHPTEKQALLKTLQWVNEKMEFRPGEYAYKKTRKCGFTITSKIPMIRWGQAWMLRALCEMKSNI